MRNSKEQAFADYRYASPETIRGAIAGDPDACKVVQEIYQEEAERFAKACLRKNKRKGRNIPLEDILQTAWIGISQSIRKFKKSRGRSYRRRVYVSRRDYRYYLSVI